MLFVGPLTQRSGCLEALTAAARMLQYPTISLVMLGDGPEKGELQKRAEAMGVAEQVVISPQEVEPIAAMKEANLLFYPDGIDANEQTLLEAAAAGVPIVTAENELVNELFRDGESALICKTGDISCFQEQANLLLNDVSLRKKLARNAREDVLALVVQDADEYLTAFRESVERAIYEFETPPEEEPTAPAQEMPERA